MNTWTVHDTQVVRDRPCIGASANVPTGRGTFRFVVFRHTGDAEKEHVGIVAGNVAGEDVLLGVHSECITSDVFGSTQCDCSAELQLTLDAIAREGRGVLVYLRFGTGGLAAAKTLLRELGVKSVRLRSGNAEQTLLREIGED